MKLKIFFTLLLIVLASTFQVYLGALSMEELGKVAAQQFSLDTSYAQTSTAMNLWKFFGNPKFINSILVLSVLFLWRKELSKLAIWLATPIVFVAFMLGAPQDAQAYYSKVDYAEVVNVLPNHSAFIIPAVGENKDSQAQFESEAYLNSKKVGAKRVTIPHGKLSNSSLISDYYVPSAVLVLLDRSPYVVTWDNKIDQNNKEDYNREMCVETQDSIHVCFDVSIGLNVTEEDASKYLYWFGVDAVDKNLSAEEQQFPSVLHGKALSTTANSRIYPRIHAAYFEEFAKHPFKELGVKKSEILANVRTKLTAEYKNMGITVEYIGIASQFRYDKSIQDSINVMQAAIFQQEATISQWEIAKLERFRTETQIALNRSNPYVKWNGQLPAMPSTFVGATDVVNWLKDFWKSDK